MTAVLSLLLLVLPASAKRVRTAPAAPTVPFASSNLTLTVPLSAPLSAPALTLAVPTLTPTLIPSLAVTPAARPQETQATEPTNGTQAPTSTAESAAAASARTFDGTGKAGFFFNDHDASVTYAEPLKAFVARHDSVMVEMLAGAHDTAIFQKVSDGKLSPTAALRLLKNKEPLNKAVLKALHKTGKKVLPESIHLPAYKDLRREIDAARMPKASALLEEAYYAFTEEGDAVAAAAAMRAFNAVMVEVHAKREEALLQDVKSRVGRGEDVGVMLGMFHTWPYQELRKLGVKVSREFHPRPERGMLRLGPHVQSLRRLRFGKPAPTIAQDLREELSFLILHFFLDPRFRQELAAEKAKVDSAILGRMKQKDFEALAEELSAYSSEHGDLSIGDPRLGGHVLRWLLSEGFLKKDEKRFFRLR